MVRDGGKFMQAPAREAPKTDNDADDPKRHNPTVTERAGVQEIEQPGERGSHSHSVGLASISRLTPISLDAINGSRPGEGVSGGW